MPETVVVQRRRRPYRKSRFGCRNCKLRSIKCDENKPACYRCNVYGVRCSFVAGSSDLQVSIPLLQYQRAKSATRARPTSPLYRQLMFPIICSDDTTSFEITCEYKASLERFRFCTLHSYGPQMMCIWRDRIPPIAFRHPYLMHTMLGVGAVYNRYRAMPAASPQTRVEAHHYAQCVTLFKQKLRSPIALSDRDAVWATAALLGTLVIASFDISVPEDAWPLRSPSVSDLDWFSLSYGKQVVWEMTDPLRPGGVFRAMANEYAQMHFAIPTSGVEGIPATLVEVTNMDHSSNEVKNSYFVATHVLVQFQKLPSSQTNSVRMLSFVTQSPPAFRRLLLGKDPVALLLLALWYGLAGKVLWWIEKRAQVEGKAIRLYLEQHHPDKVLIHQLLT